MLLRKRRPNTAPRGVAAGTEEELCSRETPVLVNKNPDLTYSVMGIQSDLVPRAATTSDVFNAVAESCRRDILIYLAPRERAVGDIVAVLRLAQPSVSKHLKVLRHVGLVHVRREGRQMFYRTNVEAIRPLQEWAQTFERFWRHQLAGVKQRAERKSDSAKDE